MKNKKTEKFLPITISKKQAGDTGMAIVLILLLLGFFTKNIIFYKIAIPVLVINMTVPMFYYFFAILWLGFSRLLGMFVSKILLTIIYMILVVPVSLIRKTMGKDTLQLREFKKGTNSVMKVRDHTFSPVDIEKPF